MVERKVKLMSVQASPVAKKIAIVLGDGARLRPEKGVDPAGARPDFPERERADQNADLRGDESPGRPVLLHRQAPDRPRGELSALAPPCLARHRALPTPMAPKVGAS